MAAGGGSRGGGGKAGAIRAGGAFVEIFADDMSVVRSFEKLKGYLNSVGKQTRAAGALAVGAGAAVLAPIGAAFGYFLNRGDDIKKASDRLGVTAESLSALSYAAEQSGSNLEGLEKGMRKLQQTVYEASESGGEAAEMFRTLGLEAKDLLALSPDEQWLAVADALSQVENATERNALAQKAMGKGAAELIPLLLGGSKGVRELMNEAGRVGSIVTSEEAAAAERIGDALSRAWTSAKGIVFSIGAALMPQESTITKATEWIIRATASVRSFIAENKQMVLGVVMGAVAIIGIGVGLIGLGYAFTILGTAVGGIASALMLVKGAAAIALGSLLGVKAVLALLAFLVSPLGLAVLAGTAIVGFLGYMASDTETAKAAVQELGQAWGFVKGTALDAWGGIRDAITAGDLQLAFKIAMNGLAVIWAGFVQGATAKWNLFKSFFVDAWHDGIMLFQLAWNDAQAIVGDSFLALLQTLVQQFESTFTKIFEFAAKAASAVGLDAVAKELDMFAELGKKGQLSGVFGEARKDLAKDAERNSIGITNERQDQQAKSDAARAAGQAGADADLATAKADLAASIAEAKVAAEAARERAKETNKTIPQLGRVVSELTRGAQGARDFSKIFSAGDTVNDKILQANLKNGDTIKKTNTILEEGFAGLAGVGAGIRFGD